MSEQYPSDAQLLALTQDADTGVEYIPTGQSPYVLHYRKMLQRLLVASGRANDLRVYAQDALSVGVRAGRATINATPIVFVGQTDITLTANQTHHVWLDSAGLIQTSTSGLPSDRSTYIPLAQIVTGSSAITQLTDLRSEAIYTTPGLAAQGLTATSDEINQALDGINSTVDAQALNVLTGGGWVTADTEHRHLQVLQDANAETYFSLINDNSGGSAQTALLFSLPNVLPDDLALMQSRSHGFLTQRYDGKSQTLLGATDQAWLHAGDFAASITNQLLGVCPVAGEVVALQLSAGLNLQSSDSADGLAVTLKKNGTSITAVDASLTSNSGSGFRSTAQGDGAAGVLTTGGDQMVNAGDLFTIDVTRTANGTVSQEASDVAVLVVIRASQPE